MVGHDRPRGKLRESMVTPCHTPIIFSNFMHTCLQRSGTMIETATSQTMVWVLYCLMMSVDLEEDDCHENFSYLNLLKHYRNLVGFSKTVFVWICRRAITRSFEVDKLDETADLYAQFRPLLTSAALVSEFDDAVYFYSSPIKISLRYKDFFDRFSKHLYSNYGPTMLKKKKTLESLAFFKVTDYPQVVGSFKKVESQQVIISCVIIMIQ
jgi:hypothetical protein